MTGIRRGSSFADSSKSDQVRKGVHFEGNDNGDFSRNGVRRKHHSLLISHFISTVIHLISSILLYLSWHFAEDQCGETSIFLTNLLAILILIYALTVVVKVAVLIKHFCHIRVPAKYITIITTIIAAKQFLLAVICEVFLEASTMVPSSGCPAIRDTLPVWSARLFYLFSIIVNSVFFALSNKLHTTTEDIAS